MPIRRLLSIVVGAAIAATSAVFAVSVAAQEPFPTSPIELIIPTPPGGGTDIAARMLAEEAEQFLGQPVVVVNRPGAGGSVGVTRLTQTRPDGYTLAFVWNAPLTIVPHTLSVPYGPDDVEPVSQITGGTPLIFCVKAEFPAADGREFVDLLKENPDRYTYGTDGIGATVHLAAERLFQALDIRMRPVPFGGAGETLTAFLGDHIDIYGGSIPSILSHMREGDVKCLLATSAEPIPELPDAITAGELGFADRATDLWRGVIAPNGVPEERLAILQDGFAQAAQTERFRAFTSERGEYAVGSTSEEFRDLILAEHRDFGEIVKSLGIERQE